MLVLTRLISPAAMLAALLASGEMALAGNGQPSPWQLGFQEAASPVMENVAWFHDFLLYIITLITAFVLVLLVLVVLRFNARANPTPSRTTHNTMLEVVWTLVPVAILVMIAIPSFKLLFHQTTIPQSDLTIKATGKQWFWTYSYPDNQFEFDSLMIQDKDLKDGQPRLLTVDNEIVVPVNKNVRVQVTASDVIHAFAVPAFGIIIDAVPGRLNETWFRATKEGVYYGQCRELCGKDHAYMPITVRVVSERDYATWVEQAKQKFAQDRSTQPTAVASVAGARAE